MMVHRGIGSGNLKVDFSTLWVQQDYMAELLEINPERVNASKAVSLVTQGIDREGLGFLE